MTRREALIGFGLFGTALTIPAVMCCGPSTTLALRPWSGPPPAEHDVRMRALSYAVLAPNAHNTQPWSLALHEKDEIVLYVDRTRLLPATDPPFRQAHVSQGTFLELLVIALAEFGHGAEVTLFPEGEYSEMDDRPVARVRVLPEPARRDPLFAQIALRRSNKRPYDPDAKLTSAQIASIEKSLGADAGASIKVLDAPKSRETIARICTDAMAVEVEDRARNVETAKWFRFSSAELEEKRDGFGLEHNGKSGFTRWFAETFVLDRESSANPEGAFATGAIDMARDQAASAPAFGVLATPDNTRRAQVLAGRAYARIALTVQALGLAMHPMSQALEEYSDMTKVKARLEREVALAPGGTVQMFFRLGHAEASPHTPRRSVRDMVRSS